MKKTILLYLKHVLLTVLVALVVGLIALLFSNNRVKFNRNYSINSQTLNNEGPFYVVKNDSTISAAYIRGNEKEGFFSDEAIVKGVFHESEVFYYPDSSSFTITVPLQTTFLPEPSTYEMPAKILLLSDIEGGFSSFRKLLIVNEVVDANLDWAYGEGHLVLAGDFVDRGYFVTQVLYLIFKLEQQAKQAGGKVHYILGNHEIMNMQGNDDYAAFKYTSVATLLGLKHYQLYDNKSTLLGRWLHSKNVIEKIGDNLIVHGGLHPDFATANLSLDSINQKTRRNYSNVYVPKRNSDLSEEALLFSSSRCPYWYRGYFEDEPSGETMDSVLNYFNCKRIIVGHTVQGSVRSLVEGRVIAIDVQHPQEEWGSYFPSPISEALLIENNRLFRVTDIGEKEAIE